MQAQSIAMNMKESRDSESFSRSKCQDCTLLVVYAGFLLLLGGPPFRVRLPVPVGCSTLQEEPKFT